MTRDSIVVDVAIDPDVDAPEPAKFAAWIRAALGPGAAGELALEIVGEAESAALNARFRGRDAPTNVLAFPADAPPQPGTAPRPIGDIVICGPVVVREAHEQGKDEEAHFAHMAVHGALHLAGFGHDDPAAAREMEARERRILETFGFSDPYGVG